MNSTYTFWAVAAAFVAVALAFLLPPLLRKRKTAAQAGRRSINIAVYRDQMKEMEVDHRNGLLTDEQFAAAKIELEARLAQDAIENGDEAPSVSRSGRVLGVILAGLVPMLAFGLYMQIGNPEAIAASDARGGHDIMQLIQQVEEKTKKDPNDAAAWAMLARTYSSVGHWPEAMGAYEKAYALQPDTPAIMTGYAEALAINNNRILEGKPMGLVLKALEKDPDDMKGLELAGIGNFQQRNYAQASYYFKRLLKQLPPESPYAQDIAEAQKEAKRLSEAGMTGMDNLSEPAKKAAPGASISGQVEIAPALKAKVAQNDVVFLFARPAAGGAPVAAIRASAGNFPLKFELTDAMAMSPDNRLSNFKEIDLVVRVAKSGDVKGAAGDLEGSLAKVKVGASGVKLVIDQVRK